MSGPFTNRKSAKSKLPSAEPNQHLLPQHAKTIRGLLKQTINVVETGKLLIECKKLAGHANWGTWLKEEFEWSEQTALNVIPPKTKEKRAMSSSW